MTDRMEQAMAVGTARYADVIDALNGRGLPTVFTQTGQHLLITDAEDSLSWGREEQRGWGVGLYAAPSEYDDGPLAFAASEDCSTATLFGMVGEVLGVPPAASSDERTR